MPTSLVLQQDYLWFLCLLAWGVCFVSWWSQKRGDAAWAWLPWAAGAGLAVSVVELISFSLPVEPRPYVPPYAHWDWTEGLITTLMIVGWYGSAATRSRLRTSLTVIATMLTMLSGSARVYFPHEATAALAVSLLAAGLIHLQAARGPARLALVVTLLAALAAGTGPLAEFVLQPRRWADLDSWSLAGAFLQLVAAVIVAWSLFAGRLSGLHSRNPEIRVLILICGAWLVLGLGFAWLMASFTRHNFEAAAVSRVRQAAELFEPAQMAELLNDEFRLERVSELTRENGARTYGVVKRMETPAGWTATKTLSRIERANPDVYFTAFGTLRDRWLLLFGSDQQYGPASSVALFRRDDARDATDWNAQQTSYLRPHVTLFGLQTYARAAVLAPDGRMLGWTILLFSVQTWIAAQAQARLLVFVIVALGLGLAALMALQRHRWRERESARALAASAQEADRLKTAFLAKVSHELRTPIQSILGYSELLRPTLADAVSRSRLHALRQHTDLMLRLVNDLLDLSAIQIGAFRLKEQPTCLADLVFQTAESLRPRAEMKGLVYSIEIDPLVPAWALADGERVRQIVLNLVSNAVKFTDRGRVTVRFGPGAAPDQVLFEVSDSGPGIPAPERARLFQPFARLEATAAKEGTGLGLSLAAALCRSMRGQIALKDTPGAGATFVASFHATPCPPPEAGRRLPLSDVRSLHGRHVLVADDNALVRELFAAFLQEAGAVCVAVPDGEAALAAFQRERFDGVVLDLAMPRMDGWETARRLRSAAPAGFRLVGVSAHAGAAERVRAEAAGFDVFLSKPVELETLAAALGAPGPVDPVRLPNRTEELMARLRVQFRTESSAQRAAVITSLQEHDLAGVQAAAHYLRNSALVVCDELLRESAGRLEDAARTGNRPAVDLAWRDCERQLGAWIDSSTSAGGNPPAVSTQSATIPSSS